MADEKKEPPAEAEEKTPAPKRKAAPRSTKSDEAPEPKPAKKEEKAAPKAPRRPTLDPEAARLLGVRRSLSRRRPKFVRQATHRYWRIGRWESWRRPRGLQSKQRRHYGYRPKIVRIGYGSPAATRGLTPSGFRPVLVQTEAEIQKITPDVEAALIARTVGTRRRLALEESCRKLGIHILNPIVKEREET